MLVTLLLKTGARLSTELQTPLRSNRANSQTTAPSGADVKGFAKQMIDDHTKAGNDFKAAVQAANMPPPKEEPDAKGKATLTKLQAAKV